MVIRCKQIDAFTTTPFQGNPAAVVIDGELLKEDEMQLIANEMNLSETAFICPLSDDSIQADFRLRWFTPTTEVDLCGHATIAALHALAEEGRYNIEVGETQRLLLETRSGILPVDVEWQGQQPLIYFGIPRPTFTPFEGTTEALLHAIGLNDSALHAKGEILQAQNGYLFVNLKDQSQLDKASPNIPQLRNLQEHYGVTAVTCMTTNLSERNTDLPDADWELRFFAPALGVLEDPVTGSANGPTLPYLKQIGALPDTQDKATGVQGRSLDRLGTVLVEERYTDSSNPELLIAGHATTVMEGTLKF